ncbi:MAG: MobA/MobL family protein [Pseudomonadota bacterium]
MWVVLDAPDWMKDRAKLWNAVEVVERRKDAQLAREIQLSLPHELDAQQNQNMVLSFIQSHFVDRGMIADAAIHAPDRQGDQRNIHAHVMLTMRDLTGDGFGKKNRQWNTPEQLTEWRKSWADHQNEVFRELGMEQRVDHRSYADQGVDREPMQHLGTVANDMERKGKNSRVGDENRVRQQRNSERAALAQEAAQTARTLAAEQAKQEEITNTQKAALQSHLMHDDIEMGRRHNLQTARLDADLAKRNDERRHQLEAEQQRLEQQLASDGWRKLMRDLLGKTRRDTEELETTRLNLENMRMREAQERQALQAQQEAEKHSRSQDDQQRKQAYDLKLEQERQAALKQATQADKPNPQPTPATDRLKASWERTGAPEQDNRAPGVQDFHKAAVAPSQAVEDHKAKIRARLQAERDSRSKGFERE